LPNTLVHIGFNGLTTKAFIKKPDLLWIYLGCIIPDFSWIIRRIVTLLFPSINGYDLQTYVTVQASLLFSLLLSAIFASVSKSYLKTFLILSIGALLHLLLDSIQIKWGNGVHLFAPFNWDLTNYGFFWPESLGSYLLTLVGIIFFFYNWREINISKPEILLSKSRILISLVLLLIYFLLPLKFMLNIEEENNRFISTLKNPENRIGNYIEMDRKKVNYDNITNSYWIESFNKDKIELQNVENLSSNIISIKGIFVTNDLIFVNEYHKSWDTFRDGASYFGLLLIFIAWMSIIRFKNT